MDQMDHYEYVKRCQIQKETIDSTGTVPMRAMSKNAQISFSHDPMTNTLLARMRSHVLKSDHKVSTKQTTNNELEVITAKPWNLFKAAIFLLLPEKWTWLRSQFTLEFETYYLETTNETVVRRICPHKDYEESHLHFQWLATGEPAISMEETKKRLEEVEELVCSIPQHYFVFKDPKFLSRYYECLARVQEAMQEGM